MRPYVALVRPNRLQVGPSNVITPLSCKGTKPGVMQLQSPVRLVIYCQLVLEPLKHDHNFIRFEWP